MRIIAADIPVHDDDLPLIACGVAIVGAVVLAVFACTSTPPPSDVVDVDARGLLSRSIRDSAGSGCKLHVHATLTPSTPVSAVFAGTPPPPKVVEPVRKREVVKPQEPRRDEPQPEIASIFDTPHDDDAFELALRDNRPLKPADIDLHVPSPSPIVPSAEDVDTTFICIYPGADVRDFRATLHAAVLKCAHAKLWGDVASTDDARYVVHVREGDASAGACIEAELAKARPHMVEDVSAPFFYTPE